MICVVTMKYSLNLIGSLTGNAMFFGWFDSASDANAAGLAHPATSTTCGFFVDGPFLVMT